jgi:hypothetical protein
MSTAVPQLAHIRAESKSGAITEIERKVSVDDNAPHFVPNPELEKR